jgi:outer membrane protein OmpA-like peptidoglycan-associated protein
MKKTPNLRDVAVATILSGIIFAVGALMFLKPAAACTDVPEGLWLRFVDGQPHLSGRAPMPVKIVAMEVAVTFWGYPRSTVCNSGNAMDEGWMKLTEAVYRAPLAYLRTGEVLVRPGLVVVTGRTQSEGRRKEVEAAVRKNLATAGLAGVPTIIEIGVSDESGFRRRLAASNVHFAVNSAEIPSDAIAALLDLAQEIRRVGADIIIIGHADATGRSARNDLLSQARADAVRDRLVQAGVEPGRLMALGEGGRMPVADNATPEGRAANRRVGFELVVPHDR